MWNNPITKQTYDKQLKTVSSSGRYVISTNDTWDRGWETMVFARDPTSGEIDYTDLDSDQYNDQVEAYSGHKLMVEKWEKM